MASLAGQLGNQAGSARGAFNPIAQGQGLAADKARAWGAKNKANNNPIGNISPISDTNLQNQRGQRLNSQMNPNQPRTTAAQPQLNEDDQNQAAVDLERQRQAESAQINARIQQLDKESESIIKSLTNFKDSSAGRFFGFFQPSIVRMVDEIINMLKKQIGHLAIRPRIAFLKKAITTLKTLISSLRAAKLFTSVLDAAVVNETSTAKLIAKTIETIVIPIIILVTSPLVIPFRALLFFLGKFPLQKGKMTDQVIKMTEKLRQLDNTWEDQLQKLMAIVKIDDEKKSLRARAKALKTQTAASAPTATPRPRA